MAVSMAVKSKRTASSERTGQSKVCVGAEVVGKGEKRSRHARSSFDDLANEFSRLCFNSKKTIT